MSHFIRIERTYNALTTQGEGEKHINVSHIIYVTKWQNRTNKRIKSIKSRIKLSDGEIIESVLPVSEIMNRIGKCAD